MEVVALSEKVALPLFLFHSLILLVLVAFPVDSKNYSNVFKCSDK